MIYATTGLIKAEGKHPFFLVAVHTPFCAKVVARFETQEQARHFAAWFMAGVI